MECRDSACVILRLLCFADMNDDHTEDNRVCPPILNRILFFKFMSEITCLVTNTILLLQSYSLAIMTLND